MNDHAPRVSVVMSVYNGERFLREAVESILNQTFTDFEFIIVDDASTDETPKILESFNDKRIKVVRNQEKKERSFSRNIAIGMAKGEFIAIMDADDISLPNRLSHEIDFMSSNKEIGVLGTRIEIIDEMGKKIEGISWHRGFPSEPEVINWYLLFETPIMHPSVMIRKSLLLETGGYSENDVLAEDYELWIRMAKITRLANLDEELVLYRWHSANTSVLKRDKAIAAFQKINYAFICDFIACLYGRTPEYLKSILFDGADYAYQRNKTIFLLYRLFVKNNLLTQEQREIIRKDAARRIFQVTTQTRNIKNLRFLLISGWLDTANVRRLAGLMIQKLKRE
jgi:glycosyltransferase involved in cell wall biosynthesis